MPLWTLPTVPGFSKFMFAAAILILLVGLGIYAVQRRKEIKKERAQKV